MGESGDGKGAGESLRGLGVDVGDKKNAFHKNTVLFISAVLRPKNSYCPSHLFLFTLIITF